MNVNMNGNKNEFALWMIILLVIAAFIFFMPDIERFIFGRAKKINYDTNEIKEEKQKEKSKNSSNSTSKKTNKGNTYTCTVSKKESFYTQDETSKYVFDASGNTLTVDETIIVKVDNLDSYNQMKNRYQSITDTFNNMDKEFKIYYGVKIDADDNAKTIKVITNVTNYAKAIAYINNYNKENPDNELTINAYATYAETEINMKSDGYTCKLS